MEEQNNSLILPEEKKSIHVKLNKDLYFFLKGICFKNNISIQDLVQDFVESLSKNERSSHRLLNLTVLRKIKRVSEKTKAADNMRGKVSKDLGLYDSNFLYEVLEDLRENSTDIGEDFDFNSFVEDNKQEE